MNKPTPNAMVPTAEVPLTQSHEGNPAQDPAAAKHIQEQIHHAATEATKGFNPVMQGFGFAALSALVAGAAAALGGFGINAFRKAETTNSLPKTMAGIAGVVAAVAGFVAGRNKGEEAKNNAYNMTGMMGQQMVMQHQALEGQQQQLQAMGAELQTKTAELEASKTELNASKGKLSAVEDAIKPKDAKDAEASFADEMKATMAAMEEKKAGKGGDLPKPVVEEAGNVAEFRSEQPEKGASLAHA